MENSESPDKTGVHLHTGLWAATFSGFASPAWYWWWDTYVSPLNLWGHYASLARFLEGLGCSVMVEEDTARTCAVTGIEPASYQAIAAQSDLAVVLGGDGSMLNAARNLAPSRVPLVAM